MEAFRSWLFELAGTIGEKTVHLLCFDDRLCRAFCNLLKSLKITKFRRTPYLECQAKNELKALFLQFF